jgi:hypothetical protein
MTGLPSFPRVNAGKPTRSALILAGGLIMAMGNCLAGEESGTWAASGELFFGSLDGDTVKSAYGTLTVPITGQFRAHLEGILDDLASDSTFGAGGHAYWQIGDRGLLGVIAATQKFDVPATDELAGDKRRISVYGIEGELYLGAIALAGQIGRLDSNLEGLVNKDYRIGEIHWYPKGPWYLYAGARRVSDTDVYYGEVNYGATVGAGRLNIYGGYNGGDFELGYFGLEFSPTPGGASEWALFAEAQTGQDGYDAFLVGIRMGLGPIEDAPLIPLFATAARGLR